MGPGGGDLETPLKRLDVSRSQPPLAGQPAMSDPHANQPTATEPVMTVEHETVEWDGPLSLSLSTSPGGIEPVESLENQKLGPYTIGRLLGQGTMGRVYFATHRALHRECAIKVIHPELIGRQPRVRARFLAEARASAALRHPNIVLVHNLGSERGYDYLEMEYIPGSRTLRDQLVQEGPLPVAEAIRVARQVARALGEAHRGGLIHRDVKPTNVLMTPQGHAKLADFGLVCRRDAQGCPTEEACSTVAGTPSFMAPELFQGTMSSPQSDFYALGVTLYYLLLARLPFTGDQIANLVNQHETAVPPLGPGTLAESLPDPLVAVLKCCLAKRPEERFATAEELDDALRASLREPRDIDGLVLDALRGIDGLVLGGSEQFRVLASLPSERLHEVFIEMRPGKVSQRQLAIFAICGEADPNHHEFVLRLNAELLGGVSIRQFDGRPMYFMTRTFDENSVQPAEIRTAVEEIARHSDRVERQLSQIDLY